MRASNEHTRRVIARLWAMIGTLDSDVVRSVRPARAGIYDEDYPPPLVVGGGFASRPIYTLNFSMHGWDNLANENRFEIIYYSEEHFFAEWANLRGVMAGAEFEFQHDFPDGSWHEYDPLSTAARPEDWWRPVDPARVRQVLHEFADTMEHDLESAFFDAEILGAVSALPLPIAEQVAWHLAPPSLEDSLLRRGLISP